MFETMLVTPHGLVKRFNSRTDINVNALKEYAKTNLKDFVIYQDKDGLEYVIHDKLNNRTFLAEWDPMMNIVDKFDFDDMDGQLSLGDLTEYSKLINMEKSKVWSNIYNFLKNLMRPEQFQKSQDISKT